LDPASVKPHATYSVFPGLLVHGPHSALLAPALNLPTPHATHFWIPSTIGVPLGRSVPAGQRAHGACAISVPTHFLVTPYPALHAVGPVEACPAQATQSLMPAPPALV